MTGARAFPALTARTELAPLAGRLVEALAPRHPLAFIRGGDGIVGRGEALRLEFSGPDRIADASAAWRALSAEATVVDPVRLPGTGLVGIGSFAFADDSAATSVLIVPSVIVGRRDGVSWITRIGDEQAVTTPLGQPFSAHFVDGLMTAALYREAVAAALLREPRKVVLARDLVASIPVDADLRLPIEALTETYPNTFTFAVDGLIGSSPETLVRAEDGAVSARVLAGSAARGADAVSDASAASTLAASRKDVAEHDFALRSVLTALAPHSLELTASSKPFALRLPNLWHLASDVTGRLSDGSSALDLVAALHPTAAVAGDPTDAALRLIAELEPFDRGRYAGPVGWVDGNGDGEWAVALRCAQVDGGTVTAYAGAGIVAGSDPDRELAETELKFRPIVGAFG